MVCITEKWPVNVTYITNASSKSKKNVTSSFSCFPISKFQALVTNQKLCDTTRDWTYDCMAIRWHFRIRFRVTSSKTLQTWSPSSWHFHYTYCEVSSHSDLYRQLLSWFSVYLSLSDRITLYCASQTRAVESQKRPINNDYKEYRSFIVTIFHILTKPSNA